MVGHHVWGGRHVRSRDRNAVAALEIVVNLSLPGNDNQAGIFAGDYDSYQVAI